MNILNYTEKIAGAIKLYPVNESIDHGSDIYLSMIDEYFPQNSLVVLGGRPRTGKTSLILDFIAKNSLNHESIDKKQSAEVVPKKGLVYQIGHKEHLTLKRWLSIATKSLAENHESEQFLNYIMDEYSKTIEGATFDLNFINSIESIFPTIESDIKSYDPDYIVIDGFDILSRNNMSSYQTTEYLDKVINLQKKTNKFFLISSCLGQEASQRGGAHRHILEDFNSPQIESKADIVLMLHRPELYGIDCDEDGYSLKGVIEIETAINRYGNEGETIVWHGINEIPKLGKLRAMVS
jgi:replicative DNA helicase